MGGGIGQTAATATLLDLKIETGPCSNEYASARFFGGDRGFL
jgi:hypothetical protein